MLKTVVSLHIFVAYFCIFFQDSLRKEQHFFKMDSFATLHIFYCIFDQLNASLLNFNINFS